MSLLSKITSPFTGQLWKLATAAAGVVSIVLVALLLSSYFETRDLTSQRNELTKQIQDPKTGYVARLAQATTNVVTLKGEVVRLNGQIDKISKEDALRLAEANRLLTIAQAETRQMEQKLGHFLATKPQGATLEDRVRDIDQRAMSELVQ